MKSPIIKTAIASILLAASTPALAKKPIVIIEKASNPIVILEKIRKYLNPVIIIERR